MCMAGGIQHQESRHRAIRAWRRFAACPFRLFTLASLTFSIGLFALVVAGLLPHSRHIPDAILFIAFYGLLSTPVLGALLYWMPMRFKRTAVGYGWYSFAFLLIMLALVLLTCGLMFGQTWSSVGGVLLALAWYMVLHSFADYALWSNDADKPWLMFVRVGLLTPLAGIIAYTLGIIFDLHMLTGTAPSILFIFGALSLSIGISRLHLTRPASELGGQASCVIP
jgi:hypothetical protein